MNVPLWRRKLGEWIVRYGPAEIVGTITAILGSFLVFNLTRNEIAAAYGGAMGENVGFYGVMLIRQIAIDRQVSSRAGPAPGPLNTEPSAMPYGLSGLARTIAKLFIEFGPAELLDSFIIRPLAMGLATKYLGRAVGVLIGKLAADITFYLPVIASYELHRWIARRRA